MRYHLTPVKMAIVKCLQITSAGEGVGKREHSHTTGGNVGRWSHMETGMEVLQKTKTRTPMWSRKPPPGDAPRIAFLYPCEKNTPTP